MGCKDEEISKFEIVAKTQFLYLCTNVLLVTCQKCLQNQSLINCMVGATNGQWQQKEFGTVQLG